MRLLLFGSGRMGQEVVRVAQAAGHVVVAQLDRRSNQPEALSGDATNVDVAIDFTQPEAAIGNLEKVAAAGLPMVIGTTGWYDDLAKARDISETQGIGVVWGANFSIGAHVLQEVVRLAATLLDRFGEYDPYVYEHHHRGKRDAPSGTAHRLADAVVAAMTRKRSIHTGNVDGVLPSDALHVASVRAGEAFGYHRVGFDAAAETIELAHTARSREGFARGALYAAEWIKDRTGWFEFSELFAEVLGQ